MEVARICEDLLEDEARAEKVYQRVIEIDRNDPLLVIPAAQALGRIHAAKGRHDALAEDLGIEVKLEADVEKRRELYERIGGLYETVLEDNDKAIGAWRSRLADEPTDATALSALSNTSSSLSPVNVTRTQSPPPRIARRRRAWSISRLRIARAA